ncbi:ribosome-inactivating protein [Tanacetum coccineum]
MIPLATLLVLLAPIYLQLGGVHADNKNIFYYNNGREPNITAYGQLENNGGGLSSRSLGEREATELGHGALNDAIENLYYRESRKSALLVIIQMVSEAVRIRYIEHLIRRNKLGENLNFIPDPRAITMENRWSRLSRQIQWSGESGVFLWEIEVRSVSNEVVRIRNVVGVFRQAALALILYKCNPKAIRMPVPVAVGADEQCPDGEPTTNIIGRDGQCMDVKDEQYYNGNPIILWACKNAQRNQLWTFKSDGTIRSNGKCLTTYGYASGSYIMIFDCDTAVPEATKWILNNAGTIMNPTSGLVIAAETSTQGGTVMMVAEDNNSSRQAWSAGNYTQPTINYYYISGLHEMCLQANGANTHMAMGAWLASSSWNAKAREISGGLSWLTGPS